VQSFKIRLKMYKLVTLPKVYRIAKNLLKRFWFKKCLNCWLQSALKRDTNPSWTMHNGINSLNSILVKKVFNSGWNKFQTDCYKRLSKSTPLVHKGVFAPLLSPFNKIDGIQTSLPLLFSALHKPNKNDFRHQFHQQFMHTFLVQKQIEQLFSA